MNPALRSSSEGRSQVFAQVVKAGLELVKGHVERRDRVKAAIGLKGEDVGVGYRFEGDGIIKVAFTTGTRSNLVEGLLEVHHVVDISQFLVLSKEFGVDGFAIGGRQTEVEKNTGLLWLVEDGDVLRLETDGGGGGPLGVVATSSEDGKGVEFQELALRKNGQRDLLVLVKNVKHRVGDGGDIAGVDGFEFFFCVRGRASSR